ncbi:MAG: trehalose-phosphatase [Pigmentiphaga sp.]|uniref:trehalose-phosphatase n=1 Tax=Pigmentiphaga sp. TaxID=1977564 RepID=UPI0029A9C066|nr:trehalose-phosphatase [Pigmentiphaga sp.]MDX3905534.1 trehalose-phosphatase [Pigmentiphaga sp.]
MTGSEENGPIPDTRDLLAATLGRNPAARPSDAPDLSRCAFFFDLDGTLAPIAAVPEAAAVPAPTLALLQHLQDATRGAVAVVSGRAIDVLDRMLAPMRVPAAGLHGSQWRGPDRRLWEMPVDRAEADRLRAALAALAARYPGIRLEDKGLSFAVHYRHAPELESTIRDEVAQIAAPFGQRYALQYGKMVAEVKPRGADKAQAIERFMAIAPYAGRVPVMAGDDLTDEPAFDAVNRLGGISIKIGDGDSVAAWRLADPAALALWLEGLLPEAANKGS